ncbi:MAG TPA: AI-2E family transporter [Bryobacteraceae bacterium]|nr:AI-2E family transporter [Bryobacteraceae bacterium]
MPETPQEVSQSSLEDSSPVREHARSLMLLGLTAFVLFACWLLVRPFIGSLTLALALAVVGRRIHLRLLPWLRSPTFSSLVSVLLLFALVLVPLWLMLQQVAVEAAGVARVVRYELSTGHWRTVLENVPGIGPALQYARDSMDIDPTRVTGPLTNFASRLLLSSAWALTQIIFGIFILFFFVRDTELLVTNARALIPLSPTDTRMLFDRVHLTVYVSIVGQLIVSAAQGFLGGVGFWMLGLPSPVFWGCVMAALSVMRVLGPAVVWVPGAISLALAGSWTKAVLLVLWGAFAVGLIDNVLFPFVVGQELRVHPLVIFIAVAGGIVAFGAPGIILGPIIVSVADAFIDVWRARFVKT